MPEISVNASDAFAGLVDGRRTYPDVRVGLEGEAGRASCTRLGLGPY